jgi:site-specific recombinase XerC
MNKSKKWSIPVIGRPYQGKRDRALLLLGFAGALRRSELVALDVAHLKLSDGFVVTIVRSRTDQEAQGQTIAIPRVSDSPYCPVQAVLERMAMAGIKQDALFRRALAIARFVL